MEAFWVQGLWIPPPPQFLLLIQPMSLLEGCQEARCADEEGGGRAGRLTTGWIVNLSAGREELWGVLSTQALKREGWACLPSQPCCVC